MKQLLAVLAVALAGTACLNEREYMSPDQNIGGERGDLSAINANNGHVRGDIGAVRNIDAPATRVEGYSDPAWNQTNVTVEATPNGDVGMVILNLTGTSLDALPVGDTRFSNFESDGSIYVLGCSGFAGNVDYDAPADEGVITVAQNPAGGRDVSVTGNWAEVDGFGEPTGEIATATGSFTYTR